MSIKPYLSVVIPVFNREREIRRALESCLAQRGADFEVVVVDDASRDRSAQVVEEYAGRGVRLLRQPVNLGSSPARACGMRAAVGDWIVRLDSDDELLPGALATAQRYALEMPAGVGRIGLMYRYTDGRVSPFPPPGGEILSYQGFVEWLERSETYDALQLYRRTAIDATPIPPGRLMEMLHNLDFAQRYDTVWLGEPGVLYHVDAVERQSKALPGSEEARQTSEEIRLIVARHGETLQRFAPRFYRAQLRRLSVSMALAGDRRGALHQGFKHVKSSPWSLLNYVALICIALGRRPLAMALQLKWQLVEWRRILLTKPSRAAHPERS